MTAPVGRRDGSIEISVELSCAENRLFPLNTKRGHTRQHYFVHLNFPWKYLSPTS